MIDRLTCCVEPKRSLEAGALCVEVLVLLTVIRGTEVVLVPRTFECSLHGVHTLQCLKIEMGPSLVLQTYRCLGVCWVMPSRVFVFVYLSKILELACSLACVNFVLYLDWGFCLVNFLFLFYFKGVAWYTGEANVGCYISCDSAVCFSPLES